ncbi:MAG: TolC family protein [Rhodoferax sp.]|nr:TolC family protein [Rhodoferax sp.]
MNIPTSQQRAARRATRLTAAALAVAMLGGCAALSPDSGTADVQALVAGRTGADDARLPAQDAAKAAATVGKLLESPVDAEAAVRIALLNNAGLRGSLATLGVSDALRAQAGTLPNPHFSIARLRMGDEVEIERMLTFNLVGLLTLPWKYQWQTQQHELAKLQAAQDVIRLAANTRKAWITAVAAQQTAAYMRDVKEAAEAGGELARRMARVGNWSRLRQAREQLTLNDATAQLARAEQAAFSARERLTRLMGLWGAQADFRLADRLPDLPKDVTPMTDIEARALRERLDVRSVMAQSRYVAEQMGFTRVTGYVDGMSIGLIRNSVFDNDTGTKASNRGVELELPLPIFDWGGARNARSRAVYLQSVSQVQETAVNARSEAREAYFAYRTAYDLARHYRDEVVPLRKFIGEEMLLRYNGMLASTWDLLADSRAQVMAVNSAIEAQRDFWLAETDLQTALTGTSPGAMAGATVSVGGGGGDAAAGH